MGLTHFQLLLTQSQLCFVCILLHSFSIAAERFVSILRGSKLPSCIISQKLWSLVPLGSLLMVLPSSKVLPGVRVSRGAWGPLPGLRDCWRISIPCSCRTEVPVFLLAVSRGLLFSPTERSQICGTWPSAWAVYNIVVCFFKDSCFLSLFMASPIMSGPTGQFSRFINSKSAY